MFDLASRAPANAKNDILSGLTVALASVSYTHLTLPTIYSV